MWNYEGLVVSGQYLDSIPVRGRVELSRVKYGGEVCHTIKLEEPIEVYGRVTDRLILDQKQIEQVSDNF
jgi:hypothetical protein